MGNALLIERLKALRKEKRLYQEDVAKALSIPKTTYASYEQGKSEPSLETTEKLADYFDVTVDYLLGRSNLREPLVTIAAHTDDPEGIPPEAQEEIFEFIEFVKHKYGIGKKDPKK